MSIPVPIKPFFSFKIDISMHPDPTPISKIFSVQSVMPYLDRENKNNFDPYSTMVVYFNAIICKYFILFIFHYNQLMYF